MDQTMLMALGALGAVVAGLTLFTAFVLRRVVSTNEVHIVQSAGKTTSYGKDSNNGNVYYQWPSFLPFLGVVRSILPTSVFSLRLDNYEAYDKGRLPFVVDIMAFFRITESDTAAQRVSSFNELHDQLTSIVQGAVRVVLASYDIEEILQGRSVFGEQFTKEVSEQLKNWGVSTVKNIELMDIRDSKESPVIKNIMAKKQSHIEMESRTEVAKNRRVASIAEIDAKKEIDLQAQSAQQEVGLRTTTNERQVALAQQEKTQAIKDQEKLTKEKEMAVLNVQHVRAAEIARQVEVVKAEQYKQTVTISAEAERQTAILKAEGQKATTTLVAEGTLEAKRREAEGIQLEGTARAEAEKALQLAPVQAQITLAKEIGGNKEYQEYLVTIEKIHAAQAVGTEQAKALGHADIKVISNSGSPTEGLTNVMDLFSSKGGTQVGAMLEALNNSEQGAGLLGNLTKTLTAKPASNGAAKTTSNGASTR